MDDVERMYRHLVRTIRTSFPQYLSQPFLVGELYQTILPYRLHRRELGLETNQDYELALLELSGGRVSYSTNQLGSGSHTFTARYLGNGSTTPSVSAPVVHTVVDGVILERSSVRISVPAKAQATDAITVEVIVSGAGSAPAGQVALHLDNGLVGQLPLAPRAASSAAALFTLQPQTSGSHVLTAVYTGSGIHAGSTATIQLRVTR